MGLGFSVPWGLRSYGFKVKGFKGLGSLGRIKVFGVQGLWLRINGSL